MRRRPDPEPLDSLAPIPEPLPVEWLSRSDMQTIRKAYREGWPTTEAKRQAIIAQLQQVLDDSQRSARDKAKAQETLAVVSGAVPRIPR